MHIEKFAHNGIEYVIRVNNDGETVCVTVLQENRPENQKTYSVTIETLHDMQAVMETDAVKVLIETAKQDIINETHSKIFLKEKKSGGLKK